MCINVLPKIPTGCRAIDKALEGGIPSGSVSLIYGEAETGKTTLAMQLAVNCAKQGYKTLFIDCDGTFSVRRLSQIASEDFEETAELIILMKPSSFHEQTQVTEKLTEYVTKSFGLIVIDTVTSLYRLKVAESPERTFELNRELNRQIALLAQIAKTHKIAVLLVSQVRSIFDETHTGVEPVATRVLKFWSDTIIAMRPSENPQTVKSILEKTKIATKTEPLIFHLRIEERGINGHSAR
jgi:DNA repair protein RadB